MTWSDLTKSVSRREWRVVAAVSAIAALLTSLPPLYGLAVAASRGLAWKGLQFLAPGDFALYMSSIGQAKAGRLLFDNLFAVEATVPSFNVFWWSVGRLAGLLGLSPLAAFHLSRILLIPAFAVAVYLALSYFLEDVRTRLTAFVFLVFGSGLGAYFAPLFDGAARTLSSHEYPIDLWVGESVAFNGLVYSPHFIAAWTLIVLSALLLLLAFRSGRLRYALAAGAASLVLFEFHPFHAPTLYATGFTFLCALALMRRFRSRDWLAYALYVAVSLPGFLYHVAVFSLDGFSRQLVGSNYMETPSPQFVLMGLGLAALLTPVGLWLAVRRRSVRVESLLFLVAWVSSSVLLVYSPLPFQRRLLQGMQFPLAVLAAPAAVALVSAAVRRFRLDRVRAAMLFGTLAVLLCLPSSFAVLAFNVRFYETNEPPLFYFAPGEREAFGWIEKNTPEESAFVSTMESGNGIVGWSVRRVYVGHWGNSGDVYGKIETVRRFFAEATDAERAAFMRRFGLTHVFQGPEERRHGRVEPGETFELVYSEGGYEILSLR